HSASSSFTITGTNLTGTTTVTAPSGFEVSTDNITFSSSVTPSLTSGVAKTIYVRFSPAAATSYSGNVTINNGIISPDLTVAVTGNGTNTGAVADPGSFGALAISKSEIDLSWTKNAASDNVVITYNKDNIFSAPQTNKTYAAGDTVGTDDSVI